jgi:hypothetical protein
LPTFSEICIITTKQTTLFKTRFISCYKNICLFINKQKKLASNETHFTETPIIHTSRFQMKLIPILKFRIYLYSFSFLWLRLIALTWSFVASTINPIHSNCRPLSLHSRLMGVTVNANLHWCFTHQIFHYSIDEALDIMF